MTEEIYASRGYLNMPQDHTGIHQTATDSLLWFESPLYTYDNTIKMCACILSELIA